jgi:guanylate kinase
MARRDEFIEWAEVHGNLYGTSRKRLEAMLDKGIDVILDVDTQGARQIRKKYKDGIYIFILPPSPRALKERLKKRMCNSKKEIQRRLKRAVDEIREYKKYDYVIINRVFDTAIEEMKAIISSEKLRTDNIDTLWAKKNFLTRRV